jgi:hypothetical protein
MSLIYQRKNGRKAPNERVQVLGIFPSRSPAFWRLLICESEWSGEEAEVSLPRVKGYIVNNFNRQKNGEAKKQHNGLQNH